MVSGEVVAIMGPSGAGKTTLLRLICGLDRADAGTIAIHGADVTRVAPHRRGVGLVPQDDALYPHLTLGDNIALPLARRGIAGVERRRRVAEIASLLQISALLRRKPGAVSGGQRRRASIGRALVADPAILLMDEPLSSLDESLRTELRDLLGGWLRERKATALIVTHDRLDADAIASRVLTLRDGVLDAGRPVP